MMGYRKMKTMARPHAVRLSCYRQRQEAQWKLAQERRMTAEREQLQAQMSLLRMRDEAVSAALNLLTNFAFLFGNPA